MADELGTSGLTQPLAALSMDLGAGAAAAAAAGPATAASEPLASTAPAPPPGLGARPAATSTATATATATGTAPAAGPPLVPWEAIQELLEDGILRDLELVQGGAATASALRAVGGLPSGWLELRGLMEKMAFHLQASDPWAMLGFGPLVGPEPTELGVVSRVRLGMLLLDLGNATTWSAADTASAQAAMVQLAAAGKSCEEGFAAMRAARRQLRPDRLPRWKELGTAAVQAIHALPHLPGPPPALLTQWSQVLRPCADFQPEVAYQRRLSDLLEKGDPRFLAETQGRSWVAWAPADTGALNRLMAQLLRAASAPAELLLLAPLPSFPGVATVEQYCDLWHHPLLGERHASLVRGIHLLPQPVELVLPGNRGPRLVHQGLACFRVSRFGSRDPPALVLPQAPLVQLPAASDSITLDTPTASLPLLMAKLAGLAEFQGRSLRDPVRSLGSSDDCPRTAVTAYLPAGLSPLGREILVRRIRRTVLAPDMIVGQRELYVAEDAMVLECAAPTIIGRAAPLCAEACFLSPNKLLVRTEATAETWTELMDTLCREGEANVISKLRWKASRFGGRPYAHPSATTAALAASRRRRQQGGRAPQLMDYMAEVRISGDPGLQDKAIFDAIMDHVAQHTGLALRASDGREGTSSGFWKHLASFDEGAPPGCARLYLSCEAEVRRAHAALHGQMLQVGEDWLTISVQNDLVGAAALQGNGRRAPPAVPGRP